jgi:hypothetical protein
VIFVPETVTMFLDKEVVVDLDKVVIEAPPSMDGAEPSLENTDPAKALADAEAEQKKIDDLFKTK